MCVSQCVVATVCVSSVQVQYVCRLTQCICTGVYGGLHCVHVCVWDALCLNGKECFFFLLFASVSPVFNRLFHCLGAHVFVGALRLLY